MVTQAIFVNVKGLHKVHQVCILLLNSESSQLVLEILTSNL